MRKFGYLIVIVVFPLHFALSQESVTDVESQQNVEDNNKSIETTTSKSNNNTTYTQELENIDHSGIETKFIKLPSKIKEDELIERSEKNQMFLYDIRYQSALKLKKLGINLFFTSLSTMLVFGTLSFVSATYIDDQVLSLSLGIPSVVITVISGIGGVIPSSVIWNAGSVRERNIIRQYYEYPKELKLFGSSVTY